VLGIITKQIIRLLTRINYYFNDNIIKIPHGAFYRASRDTFDESHKILNRIILKNLKYSLTENDNDKSEIMS